VVRINTHITPDGRTVQGLGREREGSGILIDGDGLILTIGYLMVEAYAAEVVDNNGRTVPANVVGYDHETGFGLLRTIEPLKLKPMPLGKSAVTREGDPVLIASFGGPAMVGGAYVVAKREFAGSWEYLLDEALFTAPPHPAWSGAALINREGKLVGVGSLIVGDAAGGGDKVPGNMFVPIDRLPPILGDLITAGRTPGPRRPLLRLKTQELRGAAFVSRVTPGGPAEKAGIKSGDVIVGVNGEQPKSLADFYRKIWAQGSAGANVALDVLQDSEVRRFDVKSIDRLDHLKLKSTF
jgi:S1-C subfamily serine protease